MKNIRRIPWIVALLLWIIFTSSGRATEMRAAWVASVANLNFPSRPGLSADEGRAQIHRIVGLAADCGLNALMVQVRPESDALYASRLEPWSRFLTGRQGAAPGYDPLAVFIEEGRRRGVAIHAWINPYRAATSQSPRAANHVTRLLPSATHSAGRLLWMDPGEPAVREHVVRVIEDIVRRYAVAGVVFDDYFYPYPDSGLPRGSFPDVATYERHRAEGGDLPLADWRRENVNALVREAQRAVHGARPGARFGVSPFGISRPGVPAGVQADLNQYADVYSDPVRWLREGTVDYLSPQLYWRDAGPQSYSALLRWWRGPEANPRGVPIYPSIAVDRLGEGFNWPASEIANQLQLEESIGPRAGGGGFILWSMGPLLRDQKGIGSIVAEHAR
ncbi:MAG: family 10 glycosylhydrolase [Verrucomicrobia bacterium]|nr:family 10 glycosylhydrolase [Verrucomicrobiota bacterium]